MSRVEHQLLDRAAADASRVNPGTPARHCQAGSTRRTGGQKAPWHGSRSTLRTDPCGGSSAAWMGTQWPGPGRAWPSGRNACMLPRRTAPPPPPPPPPQLHSVPHATNHGGAPAPSSGAPPVGVGLVTQPPQGSKLPPPCPPGDLPPAPRAPARIMALRPARSHATHRGHLVRPPPQGAVVAHASRPVQPMGTSRVQVYRGHGPRLTPATAAGHPAREENLACSW